MKPIQTVVPNYSSIELVAYYPQFLEYYPECELQTKRWFVEHVEPDWVLFDAGANIGYYSILFSQLAPNGKTFAFEPTETIEMLRVNLAHHHCTNVTPVHIALGSIAGSREDNIYKIWGDEPERREFEFSTVDEMIGHLAIDRLDCLKIDVDSFDFDVLRGSTEALKRFNPWIVVELNHALSKRDQSVPQALEWMYANGYESAHVTDYDNYIFRRTAQTRAVFDFPGMLLSFESRPLITASAFAKRERLNNVFDAAPRAHNDAVVTAIEDAWQIRVPGPRWSYAASWLRSNVPVSDQPLIAEVDVEVSAAAIGVGFINADDSGYQGREVEAKPAAGIQTLTIAAGDGSDISYLVVRNIDPNGFTATVRVNAIRTYSGIEGSALPLSALLTPSKRRLSLTECSAALDGTQPSRDSAANDEPGIDIVPVEELGSAMGFPRAFVPAVRQYRIGLPDFNTERDESAIFSYLYREFAPARHLEFGTWEGWGTVLCAEASDAEIWTVNLPDGERDAAGNAAYAAASPTRDDLPEALREHAASASVSSDSGQFIGWRYQAAGFGARVHQLLADSRELDMTKFGADHFDSALIDGGHSRDVVKNDTNRALSVLRPGGMIIWHDFCPDPDTLSQNEAPRGVVTAVLENFHEWRPALQKLFWIRPSWILIGIKQ